MMNDCESYDVPCTETNYHHFDEVCEAELSKLIPVDTIVNHSDFCTALSINFIEVLLENDVDDLALNINELLAGLNGKMGIYHLWVDYDYCSDHDIYTMLCVYVGKGQVNEYQVI